MNTQINKSFAYFTVFCTLMFLFASCKSKPKVDPTRSTTEINVSAVNAIEAHEAITVKFVQAQGAPKITVTCKKAVEESLNIRMEGSTLIAGFKKTYQIPESGVEVVVTAPVINRIVATSASIVDLGETFKIDGDLEVTTSSAASVKSKKLECQNLILNASSASQIIFPNVSCNDISASASSSSLIVLEGKTLHYSLKEGSAAEIRCPKLSTESGTRNDFEETIEVKSKKVEIVKDSTKVGSSN